jgi:hypothetical protein
MLILENEAQRSKATLVVAVIPHRGRAAIMSKKVALSACNAQAGDYVALRFS